MMSNNMCSIENGGSKHSMPSVTSSSFTSVSHSKPYSNQLFANIGIGSHTAFPFPPNPIFLSSLLHQTQPWFTPSSLAAPLSLTANDANTDSSAKSEQTYRESPQDVINSPQDSRSVADQTVADNITNNTNNHLRQHSDNLSWLADVASSLPSGSPSSVLSSTGMSHSSASQRLYHSTLAAASELSGQRLYSPRFGANSSPSTTALFHYQQSLSTPPAAHFSPFLSQYTGYHSQPQFSPSAQNAISPFAVPNTTSVATTRNGTYQTSIDSYHHNHSIPITATASTTATAKSSSITPNAGIMTNNSRSPSVHSSDSSSMLSSGPFSSPPISSDSPEEPKSLLRSNKDLSHSPNENKSTRSETNESTLASPAVKRKSTTSPEPNNSVYKLPWGKEGSRKHRILKPPNIAIGEQLAANSLHLESAPLSAPPIPGVRRAVKEDFAKVTHNSRLSSSSDYWTPEPNCQKNSSFQRRKSVPQTTAATSHKSLTVTSKESLIEEDRSLPNENSVPLREQSHLQYPIYFQKGSIIQLGNGKVKPVEDMLTQDFIDSATQSADLCADCSEVVKIKDKIKSCSVLLSFSVGRTKVPVTVEAPVEHPFFVFNRGWSSCSPERSQQRYGLKCRKLKTGDICVSLTPKPLQSGPKNDDKGHENITEVNNNNKITPNQNNVANDLKHKLITHSSNLLPTNKLEEKRRETDVNGKMGKLVPTTASPTKRCRRHSAPDSVSAIKAS